MDRGLLRAMALACAAVAACTGGARAQTGAASASVAGTVTDSSAGVLPGARATLTHTSTDITLETATGGDGRFRFPAVPVGRHRLSVAAQGFAAREYDLTLTVGQAADVAVTLTPVFDQPHVIVEPPVDTTQARTAAVIDRQEIESLPVIGRNYLDLSLVAPNVSRTNTRSSERFAETSAVPGTGISVAGQRNLANTFVVDGLSANDDAADLAGAVFTPEVVEEFQVITAGGSAEFGGASAGMFNIVTRSGGNRWSGAGYGFARDSAWDARNALASRKDPLSQTQFGASAGGPLGEGRTLLFANVEHTRQDRSGVVTISPSNVAAINAVLAGSGYPGPRAETGEFVAEHRSLNTFTRLTHQTQASRVQLRYSSYDVSSGNARSAGGISATSRGTRLDNTDHAVGASWQRSSRTLFNELRAQWSRSDLAAPPNDTIGPAITISGIANLGTSSTSPTGRDARLLQIANTVSAAVGPHMIKAGADVFHNRVDIRFPGALQGSYTFTSLANFERGVYQQYQQAFGDERLEQSTPNLGTFVQTDWTLRPGLAMNLGLRYDVQWLPSPIELDANNVSPRVGLVWSTADGRTAVRASAGVYYDRIPLRATSNALQRDGVRYRVAVLSFGQADAPVFPQVLTGFPTNTVSGITTIDPRIQNGRSEQVAFQAERAVFRGLMVSAGYSRMRGRHIIMSRNVNVPTLTVAQAAAQGVPNLGRPDPAFANVGRFESIGDSWFNGFTLSVNGDSSRWGRARLSYTLSRATDTAGNAFFFSPQDNFDVAAEKGPSDNDQRHRIVVSGSVAPRERGGWRRISAGLELGYLVTYATGVPFNVLTGSDRNNDTNNNDRPDGVARNSARQPSTASVDLRISRTFGVGGRHRVQALIEAFNVFNRVNVLVVNNTFGTGTGPLPAFASPTILSDARQVQAGVRWTF